MSCDPTVTNAEVLALLFAIAPQLATTDPVKLAQYNVILDSIRCLVNEKALGCCAALALANLLAHFIVMSNNPSLGITTSLTEGQLSIGLANTVGGSAYSATIYGQTYQMLIGKYKVGALVINGGGGWYGPPCRC